MKNDKQILEIINDRTTPCCYNLETTKAILKEIGDQTIDDYIKSKVKEKLFSLDIDDLVNMHSDNCCCDGGHGDEMDTFYELSYEEFENELQLLSKYEIIEYLDKDFNIHDDYFRFEDDGEIITSYTKWQAREWILENDLDELIEYAIEKRLLCKDLLDSKSKLIELTK